jgi:hypothetical protein
MDVPDDCEPLYFGPRLRFSRTSPTVFTAQSPISEGFKFTMQSKTEIPLEAFVFNHREEFSRDIRLLFPNWDCNIDRKILKLFPESSLSARDFSFDSLLRPLLSRTWPVPFHLCLLRATLLVSLNWLFVHELLHFDDIVFQRISPFISLEVSLALFHRLVQSKSSPSVAKLTINRMVALEHRSGARAQLKNSFLGQVARQYTDPAKFRNTWVVTFEGEKGEDGGGPGRELLTEVALDIISPQGRLFSETEQGLFTPVSNETVENPEDLYKLVGVILGIIIRTCVVQNFSFTPALWKFLTTEEIHVEDVYEQNHPYRDEIIRLSSITQAELDEGGVNVSPLVPQTGATLDGANPPDRLTVGQVRVFVHQSVSFALSQLQVNMLNIRRGLLENLDIGHFPTYVTPRLLEYAVCGSPKISFKALQQVIKTDEITSDVRTMFFKVLQEMTNEQRSLLLRFVTGRVRLPTKLPDGHKLFSVHLLYGSPDRCPQSSTCFCQLHLPKYTSDEVAKRMILLGIEMATTFENR